MNNKERLKIAVECLKDVKPLKEICVIYSVSEDDLKKHGLENKFKISKYRWTTEIYHFTESNKVLNKYSYDSCNNDDDYCLPLDETFSSNGDKYIATELRYIEKANVFALCHYLVECPKFGTAKVDFIGALIITPDKHTKLYKVKSWEKVWKGISCYWDDYYRDGYYDFLLELPCPLNNSDASWNKTLGRLFPFANLGTTKYECTINCMVTFTIWIKQEEHKRKNTEEQKQINKLLKLPLKEVTKRDLAFRKETKSEKHAFIERVKDDMICIRYFQYNDFTKEIFETMRFYIDKENAYFCQKNSFGQFIATSCEKEHSALKNFYTNKTIFDKSSSFEGTIVDYYKDIIESDMEMDAAQILLNCICYPSFEKFLKQDYKELIYYYLGFSESFNEFLEGYYGKINPSASSPRKILGVNEYQLASIKRLDWKEQAYIISNAKDMVGNETLPSLTNKQTDKLFFIIEKNHKHGSYCVYECFGYLRKIYSLKTAFSIIDDLMSPKLFRSCNFTFYTTCYRDYLTMVKEMEMTNIYHPQFKDKNDIIRMHDEVLEIYNAEKTIIENKKFAKRVETWKKFEYTDSSFSVIVPTKAEDIANEGVKLHHCVKSYIRRVADGKTNIVFIRKNTDLEKPFFTVEITNDNTIQQVHGFGNRNADTEPSLTEFVEKWAKDKKLVLSNINKVR